MSNIKLENVRISFPYLFEKSSFENSDPKYKAHFIVQKGSPADKLIREQIEEAGKAKHGAKWAQVEKGIVGNNMKYVYQPGENKGYGEDSMYLSTSSKVMPSVFHKNAVRATADNNPVYSGCYVDAVVSIFATSQGGIAAGLMGVRFIDDGEAFGGGRAATAEDFGFEEAHDVDPLTA